MTKFFQKCVQVLAAKRSLVCGACLAVLGFSVGQADAGFLTEVKQSSEKALYEGAKGFNESKGNIMKELYGSGNYKRIDDIGAINDKVWFNEAGGKAEAEAKFSANSQSLYYVGEDNKPVHLLTQKTNLNTTEAGEKDDLPILTEKFRFLLRAPAEGSNYYSSDPDKNPLGGFSIANGGLDHMVSFEITGGIHKGAFVIAFEDWAGNNSDRDFNDFVVQIKFNKPFSGPVIPEPATVALFGLGSLLFGASRMRRKTA